MRIKELRYWVQKVLPLVYDDSLSYMELLNKVVAKLNEVIELANGIDETITEEVNSIMNEWIENGTFEELIDQTVLGNLTDRITTAEGDIDNLETAVEGLDDRVEALEETPNTVVTPQSLGYPDTKTADEAFAILSGYTDKPIVIPEGEYALSQEYRLSNVVLDIGTYSNFVPMYKRKNKINLQSFGAGKSVQLDTSTTYVEAMCYLDGYYYACTFDHAGDPWGHVVKYDSDFDKIVSADISTSLSENAPANIYTDGTYLYVDLVRKTLKYDTNLNLVTAISAPAIYFSYWFNGSFWGVNFAYPTMSIYKLDNEFNILESHVYNRGIPEQDAQSFTVHNGLMYVTTTDGYFTVIDMYDWSYELIYYNSQYEVENIMFVGDEPYFVGKDLGVEGEFIVGAYNGGQSTPWLGKYTIDGNKNYLNFGVGNKFGVYKFTNLPIANFGNSGTLIISEYIAYAKIGHLWYVRNPDGQGSWMLCGADGNIKLATLATGLELRVTPNGRVIVQAVGYTTGTSQVTIARDNNDIFEMTGVSKYQDRTIVLIGRDNDNGSAGASMCALRVIVTLNNIYLRPTVIAGSATTFLYTDFGEFI